MGIKGPLLSKKAKTSATPFKSALKNSKSTPTKAKAVRAKSPAPPEEKIPTANAKEIKPSKAALDKGKAVARPQASTGNENAVIDHHSYPTTFKVVVGTYEKLLYGLEGSFSNMSSSEEPSSSTDISLKPIFIFPAHVSSVKAVAASPDGGKWLATGSTDEIVKVWDLRRKKEIGGLVQHEGSITHLTFATRSLLLSTSEDGNICLFRARDWVLLRTLKGHKGRVNHAAVHPSGKVALSVGKDRTLRMWDFMRGKGSASTKLGKEGELVRWSQKGDKFVVQSGATIDLYSTEMSLLHTITHPSRIHDIRFCWRVSSDEDDDSELLLVAAEDKKITIYDTSSENSTSLPVVAELTGHQNRVKAIDTLSVALPPSSKSPILWTTILASVSSDGWIRLFDLGSLPSDLKSGAKTPSESKDTSVPALTPIAAYDTKGSRLTCCTLADGEAPPRSASTGKRKRPESDEAGSVDEDEGQEEQEEDDEENAQ